MADLPATTYPGFATLLTGRHGESSRSAGVDSRGHGVWTTAHGGKAVPGWAGRRTSQVPTLLHAAKEAGLRARAVLGDQKLHRVLGLGPLTAWPQRGRLPAGAAVDAHGYAANAAVREPLLRVAADGAWDLLFVHLNEVDTAGHDEGPSSIASRAARTATDALVGDVLEAARDEWERTVVVIVSDHGMDDRIPVPPLDPATAEGAALWLGDWIGDGGAAWVRVREGFDRNVAGEALGALDGVAGCEPRGRRKLLVLAAPGRAFAGTRHAGGVHGSASTARTLALVGGGHDAVGAIASGIAGRPPHLAEWAPAVASILGVPFGMARALPVLLGGAGPHAGVG